MSNARDIASGAKFVDTAGDTMTGSLKVGSATSTRALATKSSSVTVGNFESTSTSGGLVSFSDANTTDDVHVRVGAVANNLVLQAGGVERVRIDGSGRMTMPYQAYGEAEGNNSGLLTGFSSGSIINWFTANHLNGGMTFSNNGRFTVPVTGRYLINAQIYYYPAGSHTAYYALDLLKNGNLECFVIDDHAESLSGSIDRTVQLNMMVRASANDYFELRWGSNINGQFWRGTDHNKFRISLLS